MTNGPSRRTLLAGVSTLALGTAGCLGLGGARPSIVAPADWPTTEWATALPAPPEILLVDGDADLVYADTDDGLLAHRPDGRRRWSQSDHGALRGVTGAGPVVVGDDLHVLTPESGATHRTLLLDPGETCPTVAGLAGYVFGVASRVSGPGDPDYAEHAELFRLHPERGDLSYRDLPGAPTGEWTATVGADALYCARDDGLVVSYDADGTERWRTDLRTGEETPVADTRANTGEKAEPTVAHDRSTAENLAVGFGGVADGTLFVGVRGGLETIHAISTGDGEVRWERDGFGVVESVSSDRVVVSGSDGASGSRFAAVASTTGEQQWTRTVDRGIVAERYGVTADGVHYDAVLGGDGHPALLALDVTTGEVLASHSFDGSRLLGPALVEGRLVFSVGGEGGAELRSTSLLDP